MKKSAMAVVVIAGMTLLSGCNADSEIKNIEHKAEKEVLRNIDGLTAAEVALTFRAPDISEREPANTCYVRTGEHELAASVSKTDVAYVEASDPISEKYDDSCKALGLDRSNLNVQVDFNEADTQVDRVRRSFKNFEVQQDFSSPLALPDYGQITLRSPYEEMKGYDYQVTIALENKDSDKVVLKSGFVKHNADESDWTISPRSTTYKNVRDIRSHSGIPNSVKRHDAINDTWKDYLQTP
ncbi:hypothetical protein [Vibrio comitans]|uniref:Lipoprotein n=1 Tax=Vibrio comitans NBRC 102076 TaxID=1219078 RepID=A0A4Y3IHM1_9VIBR|nr:hypothetical protein [Vibrio comitans]GEA58836.1 hypothetical protein VCO01S_00290 [Vibrio comitans NBRC 102076]